MVQIEQPKNVPKNVCPECENTVLVHDPESGETVCTQCGLVINVEALRNKLDWHSYDELDKRQTGNPETFLLHDKGAMTSISAVNMDAHNGKLSAAKQSEMFRLRKMQTRSRVNGVAERNLVHAIQDITLISGKLGLPVATRNQAAIYYRMALKKKLTRGRSILGIAAAAVYLSCRDSQVTHEAKEVAQAAGIEVKSLTRCYRLMLMQLDRDHSPPLNSAVAYINKLSSTLTIPGELQGEAIRLLKQLKETAGKTPAGIAAAVLYIVCLVHQGSELHTSGPSERWSGKVTQKEIAGAVDITEVTVRNRYKSLQRQVLTLSGIGWTGDLNAALDSGEGRQKLRMFLSHGEAA